MNENLKSQLRAVLDTLNQIEVRGRENLDMLLGCILMLNGMIAEAKNDG